VSGLFTRPPVDYREVPPRADDDFLRGSDAQCTPYEPSIVEYRKYGSGGQVPDPHCLVGAGGDGHRVALDGGARHPSYVVVVAGEGRAQGGGGQIGVVNLVRSSAAGMIGGLISVGGGLG
jgi:hypothetical protein